MFPLKKLSPDGVEAALEKAHRYRLLNEPWEAASICQDVLDVEPTNQRALVIMLLATTDRFTSETTGNVAAAGEILERIEGEYERAYFAGIISERRGKAILARSAPGCGPIVFDWLSKAMDHFERAEALRPEGNDDAILRWNTCARVIDQHPEIAPAPRDSVNMMLE